MGASESVCHQHHSHSSDEAANECNARARRELIREREKAQQKFYEEAKRKYDEYCKERKRSLEIKTDILTTLLRANMDLTEPEHRDMAKNLIFEGGNVAAAIICVVKEDSMVLVGWARNPGSEGRHNRYLEF